MRQQYSRPVNNVIRWFQWLIIVLFATGCDRLSSIPTDPAATPEKWLQLHPHAKLTLGNIDINFMEPTSTFFVYFLGLFAIVCGRYFFKSGDDQKSRFWWGTALTLWGVQALLGGTHYQAFSYELRCAGRAICSLSSWVEIGYNLGSILSVNAMVVAVAYSSAGRTMRKAISIYALSNTIIYVGLCLTGAFMPDRFLISFGLLVLFTIPGYLLLFVVNTRRYLKLREALDLSLMVTWLFLGCVMAIYYLYLGSGIAAELWQKGIWFNANDVLHIGLILWMTYIVSVVGKRVRDNAIIE